MEWSTIPACPSLMCFVVDWAKNTNQLTNCSREPWLQKSVSPLLRRSAQLSPLTDWVVGEHEVRFIRDPLPVFSAGGPCGRFWHGQGCPLFSVVQPAFPLPTTIQQSTKHPQSSSQPGDNHTANLAITIQPNWR